MTRTQRHLLALLYVFAPVAATRAAERIGRRAGLQRAAADARDHAARTEARTRQNTEYGRRLANIDRSQPIAAQRAAVAQHRASIYGE